MRRDRLTFAMVLGIPLIQLVLFGFAINSDPKHLPTAILLKAQSTFSRSLLKAMENSDYFKIVAQVDNEAHADDLIRRGKVQFVLQIPEGYSRKLLKGERPKILLLADATDPAATSNALCTIQELMKRVLNREIKGPNEWLSAGAPPAELLVHSAYNPERISQYNIVPGLMGVVLTMTMVMITALAITREHERGTIENLLSTPVRPIEVTLGKIIPYMFIGAIQVAIILGLGHIVFNVPVNGSLWQLAAATALFITASLTLGLVISTFAKNQLQAMQMTVFSPSLRNF